MVSPDFRFPGGKRQHTNMISQIIKDVKKTFLGINGSHDWDHARRVLNLCTCIGKKQGADLKVLKLAAILHDIGRNKEEASRGKICHAKMGAVMARELLQKYNIDENIINRVVHCIESHRYRGAQKPISKEAKILFDADKLDSIGAIGIGRAYWFAGQIGAKLHNGDHVHVERTKPYTIEDTAYREFSVKLKKIKDRMFTQEGKRLAEERHNYMMSFFNRTQKEILGEM